MKLKTYKRLEQLEQISAKRARARRGAETGPSARERIRNLLRAGGFERKPDESLIETLARALGISCGELRDRLSAGRIFA
jgi:hypothetical protein